MHEFRGGGGDLKYPLPPHPQMVILTFLAKKMTFFRKFLRPLYKSEVKFSKKFDPSLP